MSDRQELLLANTWAVRGDRRDLFGRWATDSTVATFLDPLREAGWMARATHYWVDDTPVTSIPPAPELDELVRTWRDQTAAFFAGSEKEPSWKFWLSMRTTEAMTELTISDQEPRGRLFDLLTRVVAAWTKGLEGTPLQASIGALTPWGARYARPVPHRESQWPLGAIAYYLGRSWHEADPTRAAVLHAIEHAPLPPGVTRTAERDLLLVSFDCDLADPQSIAAARALGERWFAPLVPTRLAPDPAGGPSAPLRQGAAWSMDHRFLGARLISRQRTHIVRVRRRRPLFSGFLFRIEIQTIRGYPAHQDACIL